MIRICPRSPSSRPPSRRRRPRRSSSSAIPRPCRRSISPTSSCRRAIAIARSPDARRFVVGAAAALALAATHLGSCAARFGHTQAVTPAVSPAQLAAPTGPAIAPALPSATPGNVQIAAAPPLGAPPPSSELVPAGEESSEAILRVQVEGPATYVVDGRSTHAGSDGALRLSPATTASSSRRRSTPIRARSRSTYGRANRRPAPSRADAARFASRSRRGPKSPSMAASSV